MSDLPLVSIIVVSYNHSKYLRENLDSIEAQTYPNIELIVADDASQDNSVQIFNQWIKENNYSAKANFHKVNTGLATVLNECVELANGKYVKMIAADDYLHPKSIEKCVVKLEELGENFGIVHTDVFCINDVSEIIPDRLDLNVHNNIDADIFSENLLKMNTVAALSVMMRTKVLKETGKYDSQFLVEDYYRWLKINEIAKIAYIPEKLAFYRLHDNNISTLQNQKVIEDVIILKMLFDKKGKQKNAVDSFIIQHYCANDLSQRVVLYYKDYKFKNKILLRCIDNNIPFLFFRMYSNIAKSRYLN